MASEQEEEKVEDVTEEEDEEQRQEGEKEEMEEQKVSTPSKSRATLSPVERMARRSTIQDPVAFTELQFVAIVDHYERLLESVEKEESMNQMRTEMASLLTKFKMTYSVQQKLINKTRELTAEFAVKEGQKNKLLSTMQELQKELEAAEAEIGELKTAVLTTTQQRDDAVHQIELGREEMMKQLRVQEEKFVEEAQSATSHKKEMMKLREDMIQERTAFQTEIAELKKQLHSRDIDNHKLQYRLKDTIHRLDESQNMVLYQRKQLKAEAKRRGKANREILDLRREINEKETAIKELTKKLSEALSNFEKSEQKNATLEDECKKNKIDFQNLLQSSEKLKKDFDIRGEKLVAALVEKEELQNELRTKQSEIRAAKQELNSLNIEKYMAVKRVTSLEGFKSQAETKLHVQKQTVASLEKELEDSRNKNEAIQREMDEIRREKEQLSVKLTECLEDLNFINNDIKLQQKAKTILSNELEKTAKRLEDAQRKYENIQLEKNTLASEAANLRTELKTRNQEFAKLEARILDEHKKLLIVESSLRKEKEFAKQQSESLYHSNKKIAELSEELNKQKEKNESSSCYIDQLQDSIRSQEIRFSSIVADKIKLEAEIGSMRENLEKHTKAMNEAREMVSRKDYKIKNLNKEALDLKKNLELAKKKYNKLNEQKNTLSSILVRKEKTIALCNQKLKIYDTALSRGEMEYDRRLNDIRLLKSELVMTVRSNGLFKNQIKNFHHLRQQLTHVQQELTSEKLRTKALEMDLQRPTNIHRWRMLQGSDPERHQLIVKNRFLQKRLIQKGSQLEQALNDLEESNRVIEELREALKRQPSSNIAEEARLYRKLHRECKEKCESLNAQVNMFHSYFRSYKNEIERLKAELATYKKKEYQWKLKSRRKDVGPYKVSANS